MSHAKIKQPQPLGCESNANTCVSLIELCHLASTGGILQLPVDWVQPLGTQKVVGVLGELVSTS